MPAPIHSGANVLQIYLIAQGVFTNPASGMPWPLFVNQMPNMPNICAAIYDTDGLLDGREMKPGRTVMHPGFQIRFRVFTFVDASAKGAAVEDKLDAILRSIVVINPKTYKIQATRRMSPVIPIGQEEGTTRLIFTLNGTITYGENI